MAKTFNKNRLQIVGVDSYLSYLVRRYEEGASQTFTKDSPLINSGGRLIVAASPVAVGTLIAFARKAGQNAAAAASLLCEAVLAIPGLLFNANFLTNAAADNVLAQTDFHTGFDCQVGTILPDGSSAWYIADASTADFAIMLSGPNADFGVPNDVNGHQPIAGDTNARCLFTLLPNPIKAT